MDASRPGSGHAWFQLRSYQDQLRHTFDPQSSDVLRLDFVPDFVMANGKPLSRRKDLDEPGYMFDDSTHVLRIRHDDARDIEFQGKDGSRPPLYLTLMILISPVEPFWRESILPG